jgi:hypothetical protein
MAGGDQKPTCQILELEKWEIAISPFYLKL